MAMISSAEHAPRATAKEIRAESRPPARASRERPELAHFFAYHRRLGTEHFEQQPGIVGQPACAIRDATIRFDRGANLRMHAIRDRFRRQQKHVGEDVVIAIAPVASMRLRCGSMTNLSAKQRAAIGARRGDRRRIDGETEAFIRAMVLAPA